MKLSILIPVYNERYLVAELIQRVLDAPLPEGMDRELIVVDDGSTDGTREILECLAEKHPKSIAYFPKKANEGKASALRVAISLATGEFCIFQDADLEYDPREYPKLLEPLLQGQADVVYGSRYLPSSRRRVLYFWHSLANRAVTTLSNMLTDLGLTDMETCYKVFRTEVLKSIPLRSRRFGIEPEITAKIAKRGLRVYEVPISYDARTYQEGKKIGWRDAFQAFGVALKYWLIDDAYDAHIAPEYVTDLAQAHRVIRWMGDTLRPHLGERVLEVGAGLGSLTGCLLPREQYIASEHHEEYLAVLKNLASRCRRLKVARVDPEEPAHFEPLRGEVDTVVCANLLHRTADPGRALRNIHAVLAPGGRTIVVVAQGKWLESPLDQGLGHRRRFSRQDLCRELEKAGFRVEHLFDFNRAGLPGWALNGLLFRSRRISRWQLKGYDATTWLWRRADWLLPWPGLALVAVARKA
jgi:glycosyltransferase involved in cell wall biosynthesis/phospholipid N-methyltransferase